MSSNKSKVKVCKADEVEKKIQPLLDEGWFIKSMVAEVVSCTDSRDFSREHVTAHGSIIFSLEKSDI